MAKIFNDISLLQKQIRITILDYKEKGIREVSGLCSNGSISVNGNSSLRRTLTLTMIASQENNNLENLDNLIALNKKIKIEIGYNNGDNNYIWKSQGIYIISQASLTVNTSNSTINIQAKDKMSKLNGMAGGTFPASIIFHEYEQIHEDGTITLEQPTIYEIIREAVHDYGEEPYHNIKINDLDTMGNMAVAYAGSNKYIAFRDQYIEYKETDEEITDYPLVFQKGENIGYRPVPLTFPGELQMAAGNTVTQLLDKIVQTLGNYEYFYNLDGEFVFQKKKNYLNNEIFQIKDLMVSNYIQLYPENWFSEIFNGEKGLISINNSPKYENIKNDYVVWGQKTLSSSEKILIRYHLVIEEKPDIQYASQYMYEEKIGSCPIYSFSTVPLDLPHLKLIGRPCYEWREELYRQALLRQSQGDTSAFYDEELLAEWRNIFDTMGDWSYQKENGEWEGWNLNLLKDPSQLNYWLDFLDSNSELLKYSVSAIGRRSKVLDKKECSSLFPSQVPELYFFEKPKTFEERQALLDLQETNNFDYIFVSSNFINNSLSTSNSAASAYDFLKELLYQNLTYNTNITITCLPIYDLEPNTLIYINSLKTQTVGRFVVNSITIPLNYNGTMTIQASQALAQF